jgi:hypothetical protein
MPESPEHAEPALTEDPAEFKPAAFLAATKKGPRPAML